MMFNSQHSQNIQIQNHDNYLHYFSYISLFECVFQISEKYEQMHGAFFMDDLLLKLKCLFLK